MEGRRRIRTAETTHSESDANGAFLAGLAESLDEKTRFLKHCGGAYHFLSDHVAHLLEAASENEDEPV
jgi:hypothetical protein